MFGRRESKSQQQSSATQSGKIYRVYTRNISRGQYLNTFVDTNYIPILSEFESEREESHPKETSQSLPLPV